MFSYVDPAIFKLLLDHRKIVTIGEDGLPTQDDIRPGTERIHLLGPIPIPRIVDGVRRTFRWYPFVRRTQLEQVTEVARGLREQRPVHDIRDLLASQMSVNSLLLYGLFEETDTPLVRLHSCCITGETFGSMRCECGPQLEESFRRIVREGCGAVIYMASHEGRGIGLWAKGVTYLLQDLGLDTYGANRALGLPEDSRDFGDAAFVLLHFLRPPARIRLLSNNPMKRAQLESHGVAVAGQESLVVGVSDQNIRYLHAKRERGHNMGLLPDDEAGSFAGTTPEALIGQK
ncbi:MAG: GTP cyclohydrolase II [Pseudomonadota bacterium]